MERVSYLLFGDDVVWWMLNVKFNIHLFVCFFLIQMCANIACGCISLSINQSMLSAYGYSEYLLGWWILMQHLELTNWMTLGNSISSSNKNHHGGKRVWCTGPNDHTAINSNFQSKLYWCQAYSEVNAKT